MKYLVTIKLSDTGKITSGITLVEDAKPLKGLIGSGVVDGEVIDHENAAINYTRHCHNNLELAQIEYNKQTAALLGHLVGVVTGHNLDDILYYMAYALSQDEVREKIREVIYEEISDIQRCEQAEEWTPEEIAQQEGIQPETCQPEECRT